MLLLWYLFIYLFICKSNKLDTTGYQQEYLLVHGGQLKIEPRQQA